MKWKGAAFLATIDKGGSSAWAGSVTRINPTHVPWLANTVKHLVRTCLSWFCNGLPRAAAGGYTASIMTIMMTARLSFFQTLRIFSKENFNRLYVPVLKSFKAFCNLNFFFPAKGRVLCWVFKIVSITLWYFCFCSISHTFFLKKKITVYESMTATNCKAMKM